MMYSRVNPATGRICTVGSLDAIVNEDIYARKQEIARGENADGIIARPKRTFVSSTRVHARSVDCESQVPTVQDNKTETDEVLVSKIAKEERENISLLHSGAS
jgi:hypothetical protein